MRLATILTAESPSPMAAVAVDSKTWLALHDFLTFFGARNLPHRLSSLAEYLPLLMGQFSDLTRKVIDWPEHGRIFQQRGGRPVQLRQFFAPVMQPPAFREFCAFEHHLRALCLRRGVEMPAAWFDAPSFSFANPNSLVGHESEVAAPRISRELDLELELGIIIGKRVRDISAASAWDCVAGFTLVNDFTARDAQRREFALGAACGKGSDFATAAGPVLVTRDEFGDKINGGQIRLELRARVNGRQVARGNAIDLYHTIPSLIEHAAADADLFPGDLIATGCVAGGSILELTPEVSGGWLKAGDVVELEGDRLGVLRNRIKAPAAR